MLDRLAGAVAGPLLRVVSALRTTRRTAARVPDVVEAILVLPDISRQLDVIGFQTASLPEMHAEIVRLRGDTAALPQIDETLARMAVLLDRVDENTVGVRQLAEVVVPLQGAALRLGRLADRRR